MFDVLTYILIVAMLIMGIFLIFVSKKYITTKNELKTMTDEIDRSKEEYKLKATEYSNMLLEYIRTFTAQVSAIKFHNFIDTHELSKVTKSTITKLIGETAILVKDSINEHNIIFEDALFTKEFYEKYIVDTTTIVVKELLEKAVVEVEVE